MRWIRRWLRWDRRISPGWAAHDGEESLGSLGGLVVAQPFEDPRLEPVGDGSVLSLSGFLNRAPHLRRDADGKALGAARLFPSNGG